MDILARLAHEYWDWISRFHPVFTVFLVRWACWLILLLALGVWVRVQHPPWGPHSLALQLEVWILATSLALSLPLGGVAHLPDEARSILITMALIAWGFLPFFVPQLTIRRYGVQRLVIKILYGVQLGLLLIQWTLLID